jgi:hypothetical protein
MLAEIHSVHFLKTKLCVASTKGFEIVDLETLGTQALLDPADASLDFVQRRDDVRPLSIYRIDVEFLLCYTGEFGAMCESKRKLMCALAEFAFYVDRSGLRSKRDVTMYWEGNPTAFGECLGVVLASGLC